MNYPKETIYPKLYKVWKFYEENPHLLPMNESGYESYALYHNHDRYCLNPNNGHQYDHYIEGTSTHYLGYGAGARSVRCEISKEEYAEFVDMWNNMRKWVNDEIKLKDEINAREALKDIEDFLLSNNL